MRIIIFLVLFCVSGQLFTTPSPAEIAEGGKSQGELEHSIYSNLGGEIHDRILCIDGLKVFQTVAYGYGEKSGGVAVSNVQLYEYRDGKVVPAKCELKSKTK